MKLILHIGTEKTGTTSIQSALAEDRALLAERGILFPDILGTPNHSEIYVASANAADDDEIVLWEKKRTGLDIDAYRRACRDSIRSSLDSGSYHTILISNEHFHSRIQSPDEVERALDLLGVDPSAVKVIVYLRRQDQLATSVYSTRLRLGDHFDVFDHGEDLTEFNYFSYQKLLGFYESCFGKSGVIARLYEVPYLKDGDVVSDFYEVANLGISPTLVPRKNASLTESEAVFLKNFNRAFPLLRDGQINDDRGSIMDAIAGAATGRPFRPARKDAETFLAQFSDSNAWVKQNYFKDLNRPTLFDGDMTGLPDSISTDLTTAEAMKFAIAIWEYSMNERAWLIGQLQASREALSVAQAEKDVLTSQDAGPDPVEFSQAPVPDGDLVQGDGRVSADG